MKAKEIAFVAVGKAELRDCAILESGKVERDFLLLKTITTLISPGTERDCLMNLTHNKVGYPAVLGYSAVAEVVEVGEGVEEFTPGERVMVYHSSHRSYQYKHKSDIYKLDFPELAPEEAVFTIVGAMGFQGLRKIRPELGESVMVMGQGLLGLFALQCARLSGALPLIALDLSPERRALALELGADYAFSPEEEDLVGKIRKLTRGGVNGVVEVTGNPEAIHLGLACMAPMGRISLVGCSRRPTKEVDFYNEVHRPGISVIGAHNFARPRSDRRPGYWTNREDVECLLHLLAKGRIRVKPFLTRVASPAEAPEIYGELASGPRKPFGVVFDWRKLEK